MTKGDMVRFAKWVEVDVRDSKGWHRQEKPHLGILVEHDKLLGVAHILHLGELYRIRTVFEEKAGRRDFGSR